MRLFKRLNWAPLALFLALPARAGFEPVEGPEMDVTNPEQGAGWYEGQYGMSPEESRRFDSGGGVRVILPGDSHAPAPAQDDEDSDGAALNSQADAAPEGGAVPVDPGPILDATGHGLGSSHDLIDSVGEVPLPSREAPQGLADGFGVNSPLGGEGAETTRAAAAKPRLLDNLRAQPAYSPRQLSGFAPETAKDANGSDYGLRVLGQDARAQAPAPVEALGAAMPTAAAASSFAEPEPGAVKTPPVSVLIELRLSPSNAESDAEVTPAQALDTRLQSLSQAGFVIDKSFPLLASSADQRSAFVRGWMDPERLMLLALNPAVARVTVVGTPADAQGALPLRVPVTLHLRLHQGEGLSSFLRRTLPALEQAAGFEWRVSQGWQLQPTSEGGAVILSGDLPSGSVGRLLGYRDLIRVEPFLAPAGAASGTAAPGPVPLPRGGGAARSALDLACLSLAFPWMGMLLREIFFWMRLALY